MTHAPPPQADDAAGQRRTGDQKGEYTSLALDSNDRPRIAYGKQSPGSAAMYAWNNGGGWQHEAVESTVQSYQIGAFTSLALDSFGHPRISYYSSYYNFSDAPKNLRYAAKDAYSWSIETADSGPTSPWNDVGLYSSLALDDDDNPHVAYYDKTNGNLRYATKSGGAWSAQTIDSVGDAGK